MRNGSKAAKPPKNGVIARLSSCQKRLHVICVRIFPDPGSHAKEVGVEDPAEETFAARILHILTTSGAEMQTERFANRSRIFSKKA